MKKLFYFLLIFLNFIGNFSNAQISDGSTAPDFTFTDINGNTQNLYSYLNAGKYVAIDVFTTWCHPCWLYHTSGVMDSLYTVYDVPGSNTWKIFAIEGDGGTNLADIQGTGSSTEGDWTIGTLFPIMNPSPGALLNDFITNYNVGFYPTLFLICPNKKVYQDTLNKGVKPQVNRWEYVANNMCGSAGLDNILDPNPLTIYPNPSHEYVILYFTLNNANEINLSVSNIYGQIVSSKCFRNLYTGDQSLKYDVSELKKGIYYFTISIVNNRTIRKKVIIQ